MRRCGGRGCAAHTQPLLGKAFTSLLCRAVPVSYVPHVKPAWAHAPCLFCARHGPQRLAAGCTLQALVLLYCCLPLVSASGASTLLPFFVVAASG